MARAAGGRGADPSGKHRRIRMDSVDAAAAGLRVSILLGPLAIPSIDELARAFARVADLGPTARFGLVPAGDRHWNYLGAGVVARPDELFRVAPVDGPEAGRWLVNNLNPDLPVQFAVTADYLAIAADHRVVDGVLMSLLPSLLLEYGPDRPLPAVFERVVDRPLQRAIQATFGRAPHRVAGLVRYVGRRAEARRRLAALAETGGDARAHGGGHAAEPGLPADGPVADIHVVIAGSTLAKLRKWSSARVGFHFGVTLLLLVTSALRRAGIPIAPRAVMVVNLRRYLPAGTTTLGNFIGGVVLHVPDGVGIEGVSEQLNEAMAAGRPLVDLARAALSLRMPKASARPSATANRRAATVSLSDNGTIRSLDSLPWLGGWDERTIEIVGVVRDPASIAVIAYTVGSRLHLVLSARTDIYDSEALKQACESMASDPTRVMAEEWGE